MRHIFVAPSHYNKDQMEEHARYSSVDISGDDYHIENLIPGVKEFQYLSEARDYIERRKLTNCSIFIVNVDIKVNKVNHMGLKDANSR